ncbi:Ubiquitin and WLM domain-containing metalloprotease [Galdieria sulphuraria]|nr:Ubiquitin and WLM domain-containing metalloprotease [Galdieria sulphuraria]
MNNTSSESSLLPIKISYRSTQYRLFVEKSCKVLELKRKIRELVDIQVPILTLLVAGKKLQDDQQQLVSFFNQQKGELHILVLASSSEAVQQIQQSKSFHQEGETLNEILERLASERGVLTVVEKYNLSITRIKEMYPCGKVGIDPICVLGLNKGNEIQLRLRTDDLQGFRSYDRILKVLFHELAHCRYGKHNREFYAFMNQLEKEAEAADWTKHGGRRLLDSVASEVQQVTTEESSRGLLGYNGALGGKPRRKSPREAAAEAAKLRMSKANREWICCERVGWFITFPFESCVNGFQVEEVDI